MRENSQTITLDPDSELARALAAVDEESIVLISNGARYEVRRAEDDSPNDYDPEEFSKALREAAGTFTPEEGERLKRDIYRWREENPEVRPNLIFANLAGAILVNTNLSGSFLSGANLAGATLAGANLTEATLTRATLTNAHLDRAGMVRAIITNADLTGAYMPWTDLTGANLAGSDLTRTILYDSKLLDANLSNTHLESTGFEKADLSGATLTGATLDGVTFVETFGDGTRIVNVETVGEWPNDWSVVVCGDQVAIGHQQGSIGEWREYVEEKLNKPRNRSELVWANRIRATLQGLGLLD